MSSWTQRSDLLRRTDQSAAEAISAPEGRGIRHADAASSQPAVFDELPRGETSVAHGERLSAISASTLYGMVDVVDPQTRSRIMRAVRQRGTGPELLVRQILSHMGCRYRLNAKSLPGSPDLSNQRDQWAIFVHGCFWHGHVDCRKTRGGKQGHTPSTNESYWVRKITENRERDRRNVRLLKEAGFRVLTVWECELMRPEAVETRLIKFLAAED